MPRRIRWKRSLILMCIGWSSTASGWSAVLFQDGPKNNGEDGGVLEARAVARTPGPARKDNYGSLLPAGALRRFGTVRYRQSSPIYRMEIASSGKFLVTDGEDSVLRVWNADDGRLLRRFRPDVGTMTDFALTADGKTVMSTGTGFVRRLRKSARYVEFSDLETGRTIDHGFWIQAPDELESAALCPDRRLLAYLVYVQGDAKAVRVVDALTGAERRQFRLADGSAVLAVFSRDGKRLAVVVYIEGDFISHEEIRLYDLEGAGTKEPPAPLTASFRAVHDLAPSPHGDAVAVIAPLGAKIWALDLDQYFSFPRASASALSYAPNGRSLVTVGVDGRLSVIDAMARRRTLSFETGLEGADQIACAPDGSAIFTNGGANVLHRWDVASHRDRFEAGEAHSGPVDALVVSPDGKTLITAGADATVRRWDFTTGRQHGALERGDSYFREVFKRMLLSRDGRVLLGASSSGIRIWRLAETERSRRDRISLNRRFSLRTLGFGDSGRSVLAATSNGAVQRWAVRDQKDLGVVMLQLSPEKVNVFPGPALVDCAAFLSGGDVLAVVDHFQKFHVFDVRTGKSRLHRPNIDGNFMAASPDQRTVAIADLGPSGHDVRERLGNTGPSRRDDAPSGGVIQLVDVETGEVLHRIEVSGSSVCGMAFSPDGETLAATGGWGPGWIHLYDVATGMLRRSIASPPLCPRARDFTLGGCVPAFAPDGRQLVTAMADGSVLAWDVGRDERAKIAQ